MSTWVLLWSSNEGCDNPMIFFSCSGCAAGVEGKGWSPQAPLNCWVCVCCWCSVSALPRCSPSQFICNLRHVPRRFYPIFHSPPSLIPLKVPHCPPCSFAHTWSLVSLLTPDHLVMYNGKRENVAQQPNEITNTRVTFVFFPRWRAWL